MIIVHIDKCMYTAYTIGASVIKSFKHKGLKRFFEIGDKSGIQPKHVTSLRMLLFQLDNAEVTQK